MKIKSIIMAVMAVSLMFFFMACSRSQANVQTLVSDDCGASWTLIGVGERIPSRVTPCELKTTLPTSPMNGTSVFKTSFANKVKATISMDYEYMITDPVKFITSAPYLAKTNSDPDDVSANNSRFESAENSIIDKRIKEISRDLLLEIDIVDFDQAEFEDVLLEKVNEMMQADRGIYLNYISFVPVPTEQTEQAIDICTAMRIYESKNLQEIGARVMEAKAGASNITITPETAQSGQ